MLIFYYNILIFVNYMQKLATILLIILLLSACGKTDKNTETAQDSASVIITEAEPKPLTEAECWKLFYTFWIEFQSAIVNDDTNKIKTMCEFEDKEVFNEFLKVFVFDSKFKKMIKEIKKENGKYMNYHNYQIVFNGKFYFTKYKSYRNIDLFFRLINGKYKFAWLAY